MDPASVVGEEIQQHQLMIAEHRVEPGLFDQRQGRKRLRTAVDQVANRQDPITAWVESEAVEFLLKQGTMTVEVANDEVSPLRVPRKAKTTLDPGNLRHNDPAVDEQQFPSFAGSARPT